MSNVSQFIGEGPNNIIQRKTDLNKQRGDRIYFDIVHKLTGSPVLDSDELTGNEEKMEFTVDACYISEMVFGVKKDGKWEDIKSRHDMAEIAKQELALHMRETHDEYIIRLLSGDTTLSPSSAFTGTGPTTNRKLYGGDWDGASAIDTGDDWMRVRDISRYKQYARVTCGMRPVLVDGTEAYVMFLHPYQWGLIRAKDPDYENAVLYASERGMNNAMFTGMVGWWDGVAIFLNDHIITNATYSTAYRGLFCGAQAGIMAWGEGPYALEWDYDYYRKKGIGIGMLWGFKKAVMGPDDFQSPATYTDDFGVIACDSYAAALSGTASDTEL